MTCQYGRPRKGECSLCADLKDCTAQEKQSNQQLVAFDPDAMSRERKVRMITIPDLARLLGVPRYQIKGYEDGSITPHTPTIIKLAKALRVSPDKLYKEDER